MSVSLIDQTIFLEVTLLFIQLELFFVFIHLKPDPETMVKKGSSDEDFISGTFAMSFREPQTFWKREKVGIIS